MSGNYPPIATSITGTIPGATPRPRPMAAPRPPTEAPPPGFCPDRPGAGAWRARREIGPVQCLP